MTRLAFVSPLPPAATGIADYSADVLALLAGRYELDVYHDQEEIDASRLPQRIGLFRAAELLARHRARPYDLTLYQLGNGRAHAFVYDLLPRLPGLLVLHDLVLHHSRALMFLDSDAARAYARDPGNAAGRQAMQADIARYSAEIADSYPAQAGRLAKTHLGTVGVLLPYAFPLFQLPVRASRATAVHNDFMAAAIRAEIPDARVKSIPMPVEPVAVRAEEIAALRRRHRLGQDDFVVASFGLLTREKQIETVIRAAMRAAMHLPRLRLLLVGPVPDRDGLTALLTRLGAAQLSIVTERVPFAELAAYMELADLALHLRYPTARETSAALMRLLAQGRPTIISDLEHQADIPDDACVRADVTDEEGEVARAILRLAEQPGERHRLGESAATFIRERHSRERCRASYQSAIDAAIDAPEPDASSWPEHWRALARL